MMLVAGWAESPLVNALGWTLVHFLWQGALIALVLSAVLRVCRSARVRYQVCCLAMLAMCVAFGLTLAASIPQQQALVRPPWVMPEAASLSGADGMASRNPRILEFIEGALPWVVPFWMAGALLIGLYRLGGWMTAQRIRRMGVSSAPPVWRERLSRLAQRIGVSKPLVLLESSLVEAPVVIGFLRPAILVPAGFLAGLPAQHLEAILLHELAHIRRFDYLVNLIQTLVESVLFYHPAVWWISGLTRDERENCCDDLVVAVQGDARGFAAALVTLEERRGAGREPALAATGGKLVHRIYRLLNQPDKPRAGEGLIITTGLLLVVFCLLAAAQQSNPSQTEQKARTEKELQQELGPPYRKWLNEDVAYIIMDDERAAFTHLRTDEERDHFIEQFWLRRDLTPDTPENEFKKEHYRRISYINDRYVSSAHGWRTDRGRIYIVYGPPDEIEAHPREGTEFWRYRNLEGIGNDTWFEFADPERSGEYRLTAGPSSKAPARK